MSEGGSRSPAPRDRDVGQASPSGYHGAVPQCDLNPPVMVPSEFDEFNYKRPERFLQQMAEAQSESEAALKDTSIRHHIGKHGVEFGLA